MTMMTEDEDIWPLVREEAYKILEGRGIPITDLTFQPVAQGILRGMRLEIERQMAKEKTINTTT